MAYFSLSDVPKNQERTKSWIRSIWDLVDHNQVGARLRSGNRERNKNEQVAATSVVPLPIEVPLRCATSATKEAMLTMTGLPYTANREPFQRFEFAFAMREVPERGLKPPPSLLLDEDVWLAPDLRVSSLTKADREEIRRAAAFVHKKPERDKSELRDLTYGLLRDERAFSSDVDQVGRLDLALSLSRLVSPSTLGLEVWGHARRGISGDLDQIDMNYGPIASKGRDDRWWLTANDWAEVARLMAAMDGKGKPASWRRLGDSFPSAIANAIRLFGNAYFQNTAEMRYLMMVPALEGMVVRGRKDGIDRIFRERLVQICSAISHPVSKTDLREIYDRRCDVAHEGKFAEKNGADQTERKVVSYYRKLDRMLAAILKTAILDEEFRSAFSDAATLQERWPVPIRSGCDVTRRAGSDSGSVGPCLLFRSTV